MATDVADSTGMGPNRQMSLFGYVMAAIIAVALLPLLPVLIPAYLIWRAFFASDDFEHSFESWRESGKPPSGS
ncbi:hypothetical protein Htur_2414 [Haloterrigena turkmenica DSM 5511]|uniref:Uncharacterized protein n=1 Tax=Haloterrigena turkmenica (strain ATCC 51198 / DSM 5511 / JCM 9101 / NCIMB 13204 / VKM B-1734 / 4k) TaxID=543526 RepID=D2RV91_HALTV|nr:hypothetical protein [Haloterrigena turkmenica]ADB61292.1 hypothetical protein Htur_2414 [Haloterrigena turkmenica DSM 5511]